MKIAIKTEALTKKYKDKTAVDTLNLEIFEGELFALLGVNGAGKSTTIKMLSGLVTPTSGDAEIMGYSLHHSPLEIKKIINVSPQETAVAPNLTVYENLALIPGLYGNSKKESANKAENFISKFGMEEIKKKKAKNLSGGWQRRLSIAMALITDPKILFLDEPTLGLDVLARRDLWKIIEGLHGKVTVILTTHYLEEAEALSDRIGIMSGGKLCSVGTSDEIKAATCCNSFEDAFVEIAGGASSPAGK